MPRSEHKLVLPRKIRLTLAHRNMDVVDIGPGEVWVDEHTAKHPYLHILGVKPSETRIVDDDPQAEKVEETKPVSMPPFPSDRRTPRRVIDKED